MARNSNKQEEVIEEVVQAPVMESVNEAPQPVISNPSGIPHGFIGLQSTKNPGGKMVMIHASMRRFYENNEAFTIIDAPKEKKQSV